MLAAKPTEEHRIQLHKRFGESALNYINYENLYLKKLMFTKYIKRQNQSETLSEELRLLYVAMTRAKEKLIIVSSDKYKDENEFNQKIQEAVYNAKTMPKYIIASKAKKVFRLADSVNRHIVKSLEFHTKISCQNHCIGRHQRKTRNDKGQKTLMKCVKSAKAP